ncbi:MAG: hypothetical protein NVS3B26_06000 [Mycobacteriales bacterium]
MRRLPAGLVALLPLLPLSGVAAAQHGGSSRPTSDAAYDVPRRALARSWSCPHGLPHHRPVLLVHGTGSTGPESWGHSYELALPLAGYDACQAPADGAYVNGVAYGSTVLASSTTQKTTSEPPLRPYAAP